MVYDCADHVSALFGSLMDIIKNWFQRYFSDPQVVILMLLLVFGFALVLTVGEILAPVLASVIIAYLLEGPVQRLQNWGMPRLLASLLVFLLFIAVVALLILVIVPTASQQLTQLAKELPKLLESGKDLLLELPFRYPNLFTESQVLELIDNLTQEFTDFTQKLLSQSILVGVGLFYVMLYLVLIPFLVFFMLKDKVRIVTWFAQFMPADRRMAASVWEEVDIQIGNYVRGKSIEILVVGIATYITFLIFDLNYALLLGAVVGISVLIPYIGATIVTIPVVAIAYLQWGATPDFAYLLIAYLVVQGLDGNLLVPLLFSEVVHLHPIAIIVAILFFGGLWGFWGVFFAIPLATLVKAVLRAWPLAGIAPKEPPGHLP